MSAKTDNVIQDAETEAGTATQYYWAPMISGQGFAGWACGQVAIGAVGTTAADAMCCFDYPMLLAARRGYLTMQNVMDIYAAIGKALSSSGGLSQAAGIFSYWGYKLSVWKDWKTIPGGVWRPRRGDLVFFSAPTGGDLNHVVLACGTTDTQGRAEVISFGEGLSTPQQATVTKTTVEQLKQAGHTAVKFTQPIWA